MPASRARVLSRNSSVHVEIIKIVTIVTFFSVFSQYGQFKLWQYTFKCLASHAAMTEPISFSAFCFTSYLANSAANDKLLTLVRCQTEEFFVLLFVLVTFAWWLQK